MQDLSSSDNMIEHEQSAYNCLRLFCERFEKIEALQELLESMKADAVRHIEEGQKPEDCSWGYEEGVLIRNQDALDIHAAFFGSDGNAKRPLHTLTGDECKGLWNAVMPVSERPFNGKYSKVYNENGAVESVLSNGYMRMTIDFLAKHLFCTYEYAMFSASLEAVNTYLDSIGVENVISTC